MKNVISETLLISQLSQAIGVRFTDDSYSNDECEKCAFEYRKDHFLHLFLPNEQYPTFTATHRFSDDEGVNLTDANGSEQMDLAGVVEASKRFISVELISSDFSKQIRGALTSEELKDVNAENALRNDDTCATHDYLDANTLMYKAFVHVMDEPLIVTFDDHLDITGKAWKLSKAFKFQN